MCDNSEQINRSDFSLQLFQRNAVKFYFGNGAVSVESRIGDTPRTFETRMIEQDQMDERLRRAGGPKMPELMEARVRRRIRSEMFREPRRSERIHLPPLAWKLIALAALLVAAGLVFRSQVTPVLRAAWERAHCLVDPPERSN